MSSIRTAMSVWMSFASRFERGPRVEERRDQRGVAEEEEFGFRVPRQRQIGAGNDHSGTLVSPHRVESNADLV